MPLRLRAQKVLKVLQGRTEIRGRNCHAQKDFEQLNEQRKKAGERNLPTAQPLLRVLYVKQSTVGC